MPNSIALGVNAPEWKRWPRSASIGGLATVDNAVCAWLKAVAAPAVADGLAPAARPPERSETWIVQQTKGIMDLSRSGMPPEKSAVGLPAEDH